jgi:hypothetical protein
MATEKILIFAVNDVYSLGKMVWEAKLTLGENFGRLAKFVSEVVVQLKPAAHFVTMAGDFLSPSLLSSVDKGRLKVFGKKNATLNSGRCK